MVRKNEKSGQYSKKNYLQFKLMFLNAGLSV